MKPPSPQGSRNVQIDPASFVADSKLIRVLNKRCVVVPCETDRVLFRQDEPAIGIFIVHKGGVTLSLVSQDGHSLFAAQARPLSILGLAGVIGDKTYTLTATAGGGAEISFISSGDLKALMVAEPPLSIKVLELLAAEVRSARKALF
jgi:CRP/FNR family transcriptional regulator